jgi:hypothetical protein
MSNTNPQGLGSDLHDVKIEAEIEGDILKIYLIFSTDGGSNWYEVEMEKANSLYFVVLPNIKVDTAILYAFKAIDIDGNEFVENNGGDYFTEIAGKNSKQLTSAGPDSQSVEPEPAQPSIEGSKKKLDASIGGDLLAQLKESLASFEISHHAPMEEIIKDTNVEEYDEIERVSEESLEDVSVKDLDTAPEGFSSLPPVSPPVLQSEIQSFAAPKIPSKSLSVDQEVLSERASNETDLSIESELESEMTKQLSSSFPLMPEIPAETSQTQDSAEIPEQHEPFPVQIPTDQLGQNYVRENPNGISPLITINPFPISYGILDESKQVLNSFSEIIGARLTQEPQKRRSFIFRPQIVKYKQCKNCQAKFQSKWKYCAVCGTKN